MLEGRKTQNENTEFERCCTKITFCCLYFNLAAPPERSSSDDLKVVQVNTRARENARAHHTDKFDQVDDGNLILRRGQVFTIDVGLNRLFNPNLDTIKFIFYIGK